MMMVVVVVVVGLVNVWILIRGEGLERDGWIDGRVEVIIVLLGVEHYGFFSFFLLSVVPIGIVSSLLIWLLPHIMGRWWTKGTIIYRGC